MIGNLQWTSNADLRPARPWPWIPSDQRALSVHPVCLSYGLSYHLPLEDLNWRCWGPNPSPGLPLQDWFAQLFLCLGADGVAASISRSTKLWVPWLSHLFETSLSSVYRICPVAIVREGKTDKQDTHSPMALSILPSTWLLGIAFPDS